MNHEASPQMHTVCKNILHSSQPISSRFQNEGLSAQKSLDLTTFSKSGICLSALPTVSEKTQTILLRKENPKDVNSGIVLESLRGDRLAMIDGTTSQESSQRIMTDSDGNTYAVILHHDMDGHNRFKICGVQPMYSNQRKSRLSGYYTYAEVKNSSCLGVKFSMKLRGAASEKYISEYFGPSIFKWGHGNPKGFIIKNGSGNECARITFLGSAKAVAVQPYHDVRLMICYAAIVDEMVGKRMR
jgi:hypothetical protein